MALLAVLARDRRHELRVGESLVPLHSLAFGRSWGGLNRVIRERPVTGAVIDLVAMPGFLSIEGALAGLRSQYPHLGLVLILEMRGDPFTLFRLGKAGIRGLEVLPIQEMGHGLTRAVARAGEDGATSLVMRGLSPLLPRREGKIAFLAMDSVHRRWSAEEVADEVGLTRPYLSECFKRVGLPSLGHFLLWVRLFHASHWLEEPGRTGESVGRQLEYSSGAAFRRALKLYTGATPTAIREGGGLGFVFNRFLTFTGLGSSRRDCA
ncbi:MAG: helix-turn-helix transcriptional regulator [Gemmatimonadetes bacterium]|nr:AraC family transcriptional regulator [Gemmatimonadota bacterium]NNM03460.1 helix-turn-helix transcriptional regulator [Gemmatimonadota bacterium]